MVCPPGYLFPQKKKKKEEEEEEEEDVVLVETVILQSDLFTMCCVNIMLDE